MLSLAATYLVLLASARLVIAGGVDCPDGWTEFHCHCYLVSVASVNYSTAQRQCQIHDARLAQIDSAEENIFVSNLLLQSRGEALTVVTPSCEFYDFHGQSAWIGLNDIQQEGVFRWTRTGSVPFYKNWMTSPSQPDDAHGQEDCVEVYNSGHPTWAYQWNDKSCTCHRAYVCELRPIGQHGSCCGFNL